MSKPIKLLGLRGSNLVTHHPATSTKADSKYLDEQANQVLWSAMFKFQSHTIRWPPQKLVTIEISYNLHACPVTSTKSKFMLDHNKKKETTKIFMNKTLHCHLPATHAVVSRIQRVTRSADRVEPQGQPQGQKGKTARSWKHRIRPY